MKDKSVLMAMSGGIDSSVAAFLLKKQGYIVSGAIMELFDPTRFNTRDLPYDPESDIEEARSVAKKLDIPFHVFDFKDYFLRRVINPFISTYEAGGTPNPCISCNKHIKFAHFYDKGRELGYEYIATGHYARVDQDSVTGRYQLKKAADKTKDQSYVLCFLTQELLSKIIFPLGDITKDEARQIVGANSFTRSDRKESQDICFIKGMEYSEFIQRFTGKEYPSGHFVDTKGKVLGEHKGIIGYTIGQRKGLGLSLPEPMYVCGKDVGSNTVTLCTKPELYTREFYIRDINLISIDKITAPLSCKVRTRYNQAEQPATVTPVSDSRLHIRFDTDQPPVAKGQTAVMYDGDYVIGGGIID